MSVEDIPIEAVREHVVELLEANKTTEYDTYANIDSEFWPIGFADLVTEDNVTRTGMQVRIDAEESTQESSVELRRRNATGGDYVDIEQHIRLVAVFNFEEDEETDYPYLPDEGVQVLEAYNDVNARNGRSVSGERPPF